MYKYLQYLRMYVTLLYCVSSKYLGLCVVDYVVTYYYYTDHVSNLVETGTMPLILFVMQCVVGYLVASWPRCW